MTPPPCLATLRAVVRADDGPAVMIGSREDWRQVLEYLEALETALDNFRLGRQRGALSP